MTEGLLRVEDLNPGDLVEIVGLATEEYNPDAAMLGIYYAEWYAAQGLATHAGWPIAIAAISHPFLLARSVGNGRLLHLDGRLFLFRRSDPAWIAAIGRELGEDRKSPFKGLFGSSNSP